MNKKVIISLIVTIIVGIFLLYGGIYKDNINDGLVKYQVYLDGNKIGLIDDVNSLYKLINDGQSTIKEEYQVDQVYPPKGFNIQKKISYDETNTSVEEVYNKIKDEKSFTVKGYVITVASSGDDSKVLYRINVLDKEIFKQAINKIITSFVSENKYNAYMNDEQGNITSTGDLIESMYFEENISIKEAYISTDEKIFTNVDDLTRYLMFGDNNELKTYKVQTGDTIASIAEANKLNTQEFLIANPNFTSENNMLALGENVNISLINPKLTLVCKMYTVEDQSVNYDTDIEYDETKSESYFVVKTQGQNGIQRVAKHTQMVNGEVSEESIIDQEHTYMIKEAVNKVILKGKKTYTSGVYVDTGTDWAWPTNSPYVLTSPFGWRWGSLHEGQDISGTGYGSPIYAAADGTVINCGWGGMVGNTAGYNVVIDHHNGYYTVYAHLSGIYVSLGQDVSRKQKIGAMGQSGFALGTHLHFGVYRGGEPYNGGQPINPMLLWS